MVRLSRGVEWDAACPVSFFVARPRERAAERSPPMSHLGIFHARRLQHLRHGAIAVEHWKPLLSALTHPRRVEVEGHVVCAELVRDDWRTQQADLPCTHTEQRQTSVESSNQSCENVLSSAVSGHMCSSLKVIELDMEG